MKEYLESTRLNPDDLEAHGELAALAKKSGMNDMAEKQYREVLRLKKDDADARNALTAIYVKNKNYDELTTLLKESVALNPKDATSHYKLGLVYEFKKDYEAATDQYKEAVELKSDHAKALNALGRVYMKTGHIAQAKEVLETASKADPAQEETTLLLGSIKDNCRRSRASTKRRQKSRKKREPVKRKGQKQKESLLPRRAAKERPKSIKTAQFLRPGAEGFVKWQQLHLSTILQELQRFPDTLGLVAITVHQNKAAFPGSLPPWRAT